MGSWVSTPEKSEERKMTEEDRNRRGNLEKQLQKMLNSLKVTATTHYILSEHYRTRDVYLQRVSYFTALFGTSGSVGSKLAWNALVAKNPRFAAAMAAVSVTSLMFTVAVNIRPPFPNMPGGLHQLHFKSGIECQYLQRKVQFFADSDVWYSSVAWETLASRYENLLKEKKEINSRIQTEEWAHRKALKRIEEREKEKMQKE